jgi:acetyl esterase/lipase
MAAIIAGPLGEWEDALKKGVWCMVGEFGCANHTSQADSLRFMESNLRLFDKLGMGWCCWGFIGSRFGILNSGRADVDYENWRGMKLDRRMLEVLQRHSAGAVRPIAALAENRQSGGHLENENKAYGALHESIVERVVLWPKSAPHETKSDSGRYAYDSKRKVWRRYDVSQPELVILKPKGVPRDTMVVVMPGGGYYSQHLGHICRDSRPILESGRWVAVLHYRIPRRKGRRIYDAPREDAARAIRLLRANANRFGCSPEKIGAVGFSAGAHLAAISAVSSQDVLYDRIDDTDDISAHLNFAVPVYPAYVADDGAMGPNARGGDGAAILPEFKFDKKTPPMFMLHGDRDNYSPMASVLLYTELHRRKIPAQLFVYANVAHGLGDTVNAKGWQNRIVDWMESIGF